VVAPGIYPGTCGQSASDLATTLWAFADLKVLDQGPLMDAIAAEAIAKLSHFGAQDLSNLSWSFSTRLFVDPPLMHALAAQAIATMRDYEAQDLANTAWAYATRSVLDTEPLREAIAASAIPRRGEFCPQELSNTAWALSVLMMRHHMPLVESMSSAAIRSMSSFSAQDLSNTSWAFAKLERSDHERFRVAVAGSAALDTLQFAPQNLSNPAWAFSALALENLPLFASISSAAIAKMSACNPQAIANISWSYARMSNRFHTPLFNALASAARATGNAPGAGGDHGFAVTWSFWKIAAPSLTA